MQEILTHAFVLARTPSGEADEIISFLTETHGKVRARAKSIRKITSKLSSQLQVLRFSQVRLIQKGGTQGGFGVIDALLDSSIGKPETAHVSAFLKIASIVDALTFEWEPNHQLWEYVIALAKKGIIREADAIRQVLSAVGFDATHAKCDICGSKAVASFTIRSHGFLCASCAEKVPGRDKYEI